ncbi:MAG TPA: RagB/SusD family nutrient uptake outer membrane protein [Butyricimonas virosa]|uniref:RagB/SusD family nutrient uptake outer membrane protein n=1 Tax=Butyricimonas virosa TaxID=544645 RepID=A0A921H5V6_9BACT|nr:RagB/SusD family nutrient uptake outer membrane protein [Butyricimonas virosa]
MKSNKILFILSILWGCFACTDGLEVIPENSVTFENYFKTEKDIETSLNALRDEFRSTCAFNANKTPIDLGFVHDTLRSTSAQKSFNWDATQFTPIYVDFFWNSHYAIICYANILLENIDKAEITQNRKDYYIGLAHFYRGFTYFRIAQKWGEAPLQTDSRDISKKTKSSVADILQFALDETNLAIKLLPLHDGLIDANGSQVTDKATPSKEIAQALKADLCAWKAAINNEPELWQEAINAANFVIDSCHYTLASDPEEVCTKVLPGGSDEGIFEIKFNYVEATRNPWTPMEEFVTFPIRPEDGRGDIKYCYARMFETTVDKMYPGHFEGMIAEGVYQGDKRRLAYFYDLDTIRKNAEWHALAEGYAYPYKFRKVQLGTTSWSQGKFECFACDHIIYRLADLILLRAECYTRINKNDLAAKDLNRIRERAYGNRSHDYNAATEGNNLRYIIFKEREKELLWEGKRWYDIVRNGYWKTELSKFHATQMTQQDVDNGALYMPVGYPAFNENSLMTQNKYWQARY